MDNPKQTLALALSKALKGQRTDIASMKTGVPDVVINAIRDGDQGIPARVLRIVAENLGIAVPEGL